MVPLYTLLAKTEPVLGGLTDRVDALFGGIPRNSLPSTIGFGGLLYYVLDPVAAHVVHDWVMRFVAFFGMLLYLRRRLLPQAEPAVTCGASLCFAMLPFLPTGYLSVAGQPLLLYALLELREGHRHPSLNPGVSALQYFGIRGRITL